MKHEQGGADLAHGRPRTKKELKEAIADDPEKVHLYSTNNTTQGWSGYASALPEDVHFLVVGPDPYNKRNWYATVKKNKRGVLAVT